MAVAALGRPFTLGMLYDGWKDELIPGFTLWDETTLQKNTSRSSNHSSQFDITASDSIENKSSLLEIDASLKASFMSGLIEVGGSAKYLNDTKKFQHQSRVTCRYKATTDSKQLSVTELQTMTTQQSDVIKKSSATHVVTGILYGATAFFVFDSEKLDTSSVQDIKVSMEAVIKKIPSFNVNEGKIDIKLTHQEKALTEKFSCKFYGDIILKSNPATFEEAVKTYVDLPKLLGEHGEKSVPLKVWLTPLKNFVPTAAELKRQISAGLVMKVENAFEDLRQMKMRCNDSLVDSVVQNFPQIQNKLSTFQKLCQCYESNLQHLIAEKLPSIRGGQEDESSVEQLLKDRNKSPFSHDKLSKWLDHKERQINVIRSCIEMMEGTKIVQNQSELDRKVLAPGVEDALCFVFTSMKSADPCLQAMTDYLDSPQSGSTNQEPWYYSDEVLTKMREKAKTFHVLSKVMKKDSKFCFLVAAIENEKHKGATIYHYKNGKLVTEDFIKPDVTDVETITDRRLLLWHACDLTLDPDTAYNYLNLSEGNKKVSYGKWQSYPDLPQRFDPVPQVMCKEALTGRCYWEVDWRFHCTEDVLIGVCYEGVVRKGRMPRVVLGWNTMSWCLVHADFLARALSFLPVIDKQHLHLAAPPSGCSRLGVYLDWPAGTLSYYNVSCDKLSHIHTFRTQFSEPVYPAFKISHNSNPVFLCL